MPASKFTVKTLSRVIAKSENATAIPPQGRLRELAAELRQLEEKLRQGGGADKIEKQHKQGKRTARERIALLLDKDSYQQEIGLLVAYDEYKEQRAKAQVPGYEALTIGQAPAAGVVTAIGRVGGREVVVVANDATV